MANARPEEEVSREKALQTVVAGQQAENLLDFDEIDEPSSSSSNMFTSQTTSTATRSAIASVAKSTNPLDELMDLFGGSSLDSQPQAAGMPVPLNQMLSPTPTGSSGAGGGFMNAIQPTGTGNGSVKGQAGNAPGQFGGAFDDLISPSSASPAPTPKPMGQVKPQQAQAPSGDDDLMGLF